MFSKSSSLQATTLGSSAPPVRQGGPNAEAIVSSWGNGGRRGSKPPPGSCTQRLLVADFERREVVEPGHLVSFEFPESQQVHRTRQYQIRNQVVSGPTASSS
ncbi:unnamed protein product [Hapterophycus canaliculatus]